MFRHSIVRASLRRLQRYNTRVVVIYIFPMTPSALLLSCSRYSAP